MNIDDACGGNAAEAEQAEMGRTQQEFADAVPSDSYQ
jgi:hypothetical protein